MNLDDYLKSERTKPWHWSRNCVLWVADWVVLQTGIDPAPEGVRARCADEASCRLVVSDHGGFLPMIGYQMDRFFDRCEPQHGDVAIVNAPVSQHDMKQMPVLGTIAGICIQPRTADKNPLFVVRSLRGLRWSRLPVAAGAAWRIVKRS